MRSFERVDQTSPAISPGVLTTSHGRDVYHLWLDRQWSDVQSSSLAQDLPRETVSDGKDLQQHHKLQQIN